ncbi:MAG TPA: iron uptake porin [Leptolyngbya sp.]|jgi:hypothetical protein|nr:iron uptake porin [Leptolyngbya sp.]
MSSKIGWISIFAVPTVLGGTVPAIAQPPKPSTSTPQTLSQAITPAPLSQIDRYTLEQQQNAQKQNDLSQVTSVSQLSDVRPTDWAFQALQSLVERYGCIAGYPDRTYRGNRALTRYEFAAGLNACLDRVNQLIAASTADLVNKADLATLQKLQEQFAAELATLRGRVDTLEARTTTLEKQQFSTTTKLNGEAIFAVADTFGNRAGGANDATNTIFADRIRLNLDTSFTGKDILRTRLEANNITSLSGAFTGTNETRLGFDGSSGNALSVSKLSYRFPLSDRLKVQIDATNTEYYEALIDPISPFASSGSGAVSRFGRFSTINRSGTNGAGVTFDFKFSDALRFQAGYIADSASNDPANKNGLFNGSYTAIGQFVLQPSDALKLAVTYQRSYYAGGDTNLTASTGSGFASRPFGNVASSSDAVGGAVQFKLNPKFIVGGWFNAVFSDQRAGAGNNATSLTGAAYLGFPDLGRKGNLGGLLVGFPPRVTSNTVAARKDPDLALHVEAFYRMRLTDNIAVTPGVFVIFNPENNKANDTQYVGTIRTTFTF